MKRKNHSDQSDRETGTGKKNRKKRKSEEGRKRKAVSVELIRYIQEQKVEVKPRRDGTWRASACGSMFKRKIPKLNNREKTS